MHIIRIRTILICLRKDVQAVGMQIGCVRCVLAVEVPFERPARMDLRIYKLQQLLWKSKRTRQINFAINNLTLFLSKQTNLLFNVGRQVESIRTWADVLWYLYGILGTGD